MSTDPIDGQRDGKVVPLRAAEVPTEVRLDEDKPPGPAYVDLTSGEAQRRPLIPEHWRTWQNAKRHVSLATARHGHRAAYHSLRSPGYFAKAVGFAVWGVVVTIKRLISWWHIPGTTRLEWEAAANGLLNDHQRLHRAGKETRRARGTILALCLAGLAGATVAMARYAPAWAWAPLGAVLFVAFALAGRPQGKTITTKAEIPAQVQPPTGDVIVRALGSLGIAEINKAIAAGTFPPLPSPVREDGPGWRAEVDLPYGVTASHGHRPARAARIRTPQAAGRSLARTRHPRARRAASSCGSAAPTSPRRNHRCGRCCGPVRLTSSSRAVRHRRARPDRQGAADLQHWLIGASRDKANLNACGY